MLRHLPPQTHPDLLSGTGPGDDAAVYRLRDDLALVQTVDFFTPIVDDPYTFGQIAAANSLSDVYAVGGTPITALNVAAFPVKSLPLDILSEILRGGVDKVNEAGAMVVGGHTVDDEEPKYGLAVTGTVDPRHFVTQSGAMPGDLLVLTKPIGTGLVSTAVKAGSARGTDIRQAVAWMSRLNREASQLMLLSGAHAATDITGFGLLGHLVDICMASGVGAVIEMSHVPLLPGALEYARAGYSPSGTWTNWEALADNVRPPELPHEVQALVADPQTSGGLLVAVAPDRVQRLIDGAGPGCLAAIIGEIVAAQPGSVEILNSLNS